MPKVKITEDSNGDGMISTMVSRAPRGAARRRTRDSADEDEEQGFNTGKSEDGKTRQRRSTTRKRNIPHVLKMGYTG